MAAPADPPSAAFLERFRSEAGPSGLLRFDRFVGLALYDPTVGYYRRPGVRVGYAPGSDFFTASTSGPLFGELLVAACVSILGEDAAAEHTFVEIGAEGPDGVLRGVRHPFPGHRTIAVGEPLRLSGPCVVFSNELFDAQPFRRFVRRSSGWQELAVALRDGELEVRPWPELAPPRPDLLPESAPEGYCLDLSFSAAELAAQIAAQPWHGLFLALDYGKTWLELSQNTPAGTARAYRRHQQSNDLLAHPGDQDLTTHVCWDWISGALEAQGFSSSQLEFQEAFFIRHAAGLIARTMAEEATGLSKRKLALMQLLHPSHLGQKFQALHAMRRPDR